LFLKKILNWHHHHHSSEHDHVKHSGIRPIGHMILFSDGLHNFIDGIIIGVSYLVSIEVGIATTIAVILHEIPQEIGDFGVLLHAGYSKGRALFVNFISASLAILGVIIVLLVGSSIGQYIGYIIPFAAGVFIYIASSDLVPELHKRYDIKSSLLEFLAILVGVGAMYLLLFLE